VLLVKTYLAASAVHGIGVYAAEPIEEGAIIWAFNPVLDILVSPEQLASLPDIGQNFLRKYAYPHAASPAYVLCADDARFMNHSDQPNIRSIYPEGDLHGLDLAARLIQAGEELLCDYLTFDADHARKLGGASQS
jgi:SET domain-containing protein